MKVAGNGKPIMLKCFVLKHIPVNQTRKGMELKVFFKTFVSSVTLSVTDPHRSTWRSDAFTYTGDKMVMDISSKTDSDNQIIIYNLEVTKTEDLEEDQEAGCRDYGDSSYKSCVLSEVKQEMMTFFGCLPPWFSSDAKDQICNKSLQNFEQENKTEKALEVMDMTSFKVSG